MPMKERKGQALSLLAPAAIAFVFIAVTISIGSEVLAGVQGDQVENSTQYNATQEGLNSMVELGAWLPTIALVVAAAAVIGVLGYFAA